MSFQEVRLSLRNHKGGFVIETYIYLNIVLETHRVLPQNMLNGWACKMGLFGYFLSNIINIKNVSRQIACYWSVSRLTTDVFDKHYLALDYSVVFPWIEINFLWEKTIQYSEVIFCISNKYWWKKVVEGLTPFAGVGLNSQLSRKSMFEGKKSWYLSRDEPSFVKTS